MPKKTSKQLNRDITEALVKRGETVAVTPVAMTAAQREKYQRGRRWGWPASLAFKSATGQLIRVAYRLKLTPSELSTVEAVRGRYSWADMLATHAAEDGSIAFTENEMWQWADDVDEDDVPFPLAPPALFAKLEHFYASRV
jgi:hypothetical protein